MDILTILQGLNIICLHERFSSNSQTDVPDWNIKCALHSLTSLCSCNNDLFLNIQIELFFSYLVHSTLYQQDEKCDFYY